MSFSELLVISLAVSLDAFGVAIAIGFNKRVIAYQKMLFALSFGVFQFLFSFVGGIAGKFFNENVVAVPSIIGGIIIVIVGILMIKDGMGEKEESFVLNSAMYLVLGISVSIDASVVGFITFSMISDIRLLAFYTIIVGMVTFIMSIIAFVISKYLRKISLIGKFADYIGGIMLILFGLKMILF